MPRTFDPALWSRFDREASATAVLPTIGRHSMDSSEWYTPSPFVEAGREVMGGIDLDPASHEEANRTVKATRFFSEDDNGLVQRWYGRVFVNPPGGLVPAFWHKFISGEFVEGVWIGYSLEQLQTLQNIGAARTPLDFPTCITSKRIAFVENEAKKAIRLAKMLAEGERPGASEAKRKIAAAIRAGKEPSSGPSHSNYVSYIGPNKLKFSSVFRQFGQVV